MRDRDVRSEIQAALLATGAFDPTGVWLHGLPEDHGSAAAVVAGAAIEPLSSELSDSWDDAPLGGIVVTSRVVITLFYRHEDPQLRDEAAELLVDVVADALNGQSLAGLTMPAHTRLTGWRWEKPAAPERRITATFSYQYIVEGWDSVDSCA